MTRFDRIVRYPDNVAGAGAAQIRTMRYRQGTASEALAWQKEVRPKLLQAMRIDDLVAARQSIPFAPALLSVRAEDLYRVEEIEVNSTPGRRIGLVVTTPSSGTGPFPGVVCIHGHGGDRWATYEVDSPYNGFERALAERGYVTVATDVGQHVTREEGRLLPGERLWDLLRCVDYLASRPDVDVSALGCAGLSLGGEMAMWLGALEERMRVTVSCGFLTIMDQMEHGHCMCWKFPGLRELVDFADIFSLVAPRALQCQNGLLEEPHDFPIPVAREALKEIEPIYATLGKPENLSFVAHDGGHVVEVPSLLSFFDQHLKQA